MNNSFESINQIYKPYKYTINGKVRILNCQNEDIVLKPKNENILKIHDWKNPIYHIEFINYVKVKDMNRDKFYIYPYIYENNIPYEQKGNDLAKIIALMHAKTSYYKEIDESTFDDLYFNINNNIDYVKDYYSKLYDEIFIKKYYSPAEMIFMDIYSKINSACIFVS